MAAAKVYQRKTMFNILQTLNLYIDIMYHIWCYWVQLPRIDRQVLAATGDAKKTTQVDLSESHQPPLM